MSDQKGQKKQKEEFGYDPANQAPAEGQSHPIPAGDRGKNPNIDPAAKDEPAEGGRDEVESSSTPSSGKESSKQGS